MSAQFDQLVEALPSLTNEQKLLLKMGWNAALLESHQICQNTPDEYEALEKIIQLRKR